MHLEAPQILHKNRWNIFAQGNQKEWWYTGVHDPASSLYVGFSFLRTFATDSFHVVLFDPKDNKPHEVAGLGYFQMNPENPGTSLVLKHKSFEATYHGSEVEGWRFDFSSANLQIHLQLNNVLPGFTKFDNPLNNHYALLHYFGIQVQGTISLGSQTWNLSQALGYYDHCFGKIPRDSRWHWIAVQNAEFALASLVNYGESPQRYSECLISGGQWLRLNQDVSFENMSLDPMATEWAITSTDMDLKLRVWGKSEVHTRIPPLLPFFIKIDHYEHLVEVEGRIRTADGWVDTGKMWGVFEQHSGWW